MSVQLGPKEGEQSGEDMAWAADLSSSTDHQCDPGSSVSSLEKWGS